MRKRFTKLLTSLAALALTPLCAIAGTPQSTEAGSRPGHSPSLSGDKHAQAAPRTHSHFVFDGEVRLIDLAEVYGAPMPSALTDDRTLADLFEEAYPERAAVVGGRARMGTLTLEARETKRGRVTLAALVLPPSTSRSA